jgi:hypothetical protein
MSNELNPFVTKSVGNTDKERTAAFLYKYVEACGREGVNPIFPFSVVLQIGAHYPIFVGEMFAPGTQFIAVAARSYGDYVTLLTRLNLLDMATPRRTSYFYEIKAD